MQTIVDFVLGARFAHPIDRAMPAQPNLTADVRSRDEHRATCDNVVRRIDLLVEAGCAGPEASRKQRPHCEQAGCWVVTR